ncbi:hypothetical protein DPE39_22500 [Salmonella enterica subsp. enterica]|nr:hypothetical protein [Salmonella enterica subsp. enterica serovar Kentucky]EBE9244327.1 hypothetical protein [Salmonella enterica]EBZ8211392.1 hypothetical protein [Salmonella enterica subsp. enterica serovar Zanzibar]ECF0537111.1 hypothetical protein [Salmonella enterica subsp. enterica serovar Mishmarhaemek]ECN5889297.1 hypothetical protein [Salmonella enterica subsp. enterica serovar Agona]HAJ3338031.1 hypothetical protein [Escherichia coli]HDI2719963.1 hypothetical protein [Klebsiella 
MNVEKRQRIERRIATAAAKGLIAAGYKIAVHDGEEIALPKTDDVRAIIGAMFSTDEDRFIVYHRPTIADAQWERIGWVRFIYGNDGWDVIADNTVNLEPALRDATELADKIAEEEA